jgi:hypothetical protein
MNIRIFWTGGGGGGAGGNPSNAPVCVWAHHSRVVDGRQSWVHTYTAQLFRIYWGAAIDCTKLTKTTAVALASDQ